MLPVSETIHSAHTSSRSGRGGRRPSTTRSSNFRMTDVRRVELYRMKGAEASSKLVTCSAREKKSETTAGGGAGEEGCSASVMHLLDVKRDLCRAAARQERVFHGGGRDLMRDGVKKLLRDHLPFLCVLLAHCLPDHVLRRAGCRRGRHEASPSQGPYVGRTLRSL